MRGRLVAALALTLLTAANAGAANPCYKIYIPFIQKSEMPKATAGALIKEIAEPNEPHKIGRVESVDFAAKQVVVSVGGSIVPARMTKETESAIGTAGKPGIAVGNRIQIKKRGNLWYIESIIDDPERSIGNEGGTVQRRSSLEAPVITAIANQGGVLYMSWNPVPGAEWYEVWYKETATGLPVGVIEKTAACEIHHQLNHSTTSELVLDGGIESASLLWSAAYPVGISSVDKHAGVYSLRFSGSGASVGTGTWYATQDNYYSVGAAQTYGGSFWVSVTVLTGGVGTGTAVDVLWYDSSKAYLSYSRIGSSAVATAGWVQKTSTVTSDASAAYAKVRPLFMIGDLLGSMTAYVDDISLVGQSGTTIENTALFAVRAYAGGQYSPWSTWLQAPITSSAYGTAVATKQTIRQSAGLTLIDGVEVTNQELVSNAWLQHGLLPIPVYASASTIKFVGIDATALFHAGVKIRIYQSGWKYFTVASSAYASSDTTLTLTAANGSDTVANSALYDATHNWGYSHAANPLGWTWSTYRESGAAVLTAGAIADGQTVKRSGATLIGYTPIVAASVIAWNATASPTVDAASTFYTGPGIIGVYGITESFTQAVVDVAGTLSSLRVRTSTAQSAEGSLVVTVRKNGADSALTITVAAGGAAALHTDSTHSVSFAAGDLLSVGAINNATTEASAAIRGVSVVLTPT